LLALVAAWATAQQPDKGSPRVMQPSADRSGAVPARDGQRLRLMAGTGSVDILTDAKGEVRYRAHVEADGADAAAAILARQFQVTAASTPGGVTLTGATPGGRSAARLRVHYEVHVPRRFDLEVSTDAGDIVAQDIDGQVSLSTGGGDVRIGHAGDPQEERAPGEFAARLYTGGGHIVTGNVDGALRAVTGGGHITAGNVSGGAVLRTSGGHIQVGRLGGSAQLYTGGGNIFADRADAGAEAESMGGRIEFGTASGAIHVRTGGGGVRIARLAGPTDLSSHDGGISLAGVEAPLHVSSTTGSITASLSPLFSGFASGDARDSTPVPISPGRRFGNASELASGQGNIIVYLPRMIAVTIDANVADGAGHRIVADPGLRLRVRREDGPAGHAFRGEYALNGGGRVLHLRSATGNIELRVLDAKANEELGPQLAPNGRPDATELRPGPEGSEGAPADTLRDAPTRFAALARMFDELWWGGVRVDPDEQQKRLVRPVLPQYPEAARQAGIEGDVALRVLIGKDGAVSSMEVISGDPVLARAAMRAVEQWRYAPALADGRPVDVVTTVSVAFRLR
jgi:TonB family protein